MNSLWPWIIFIGLVLALLALDLGVFNRRPHAVRFREAAGWSAFWVALSLAFDLGIYWRYGTEPALQFFTGYLLEKSLSADNIFLFALIFASMGVAAEFQHRVLFLGVLGALILRGVFIVAGVQLVQHFHAVLYLFGVFLLVMGVRLLLSHGRKYDPTGSRVIRLARRMFPISARFEGGRFFTRIDGRLCATPLFLVLIMIEIVDVTFALDSIPAVFAVTQDAFIIFTSNVLAILGLRSMYFLLARALTRFRYLRTALAVILIFIGVRMLAVRWVHVPTWFALLGILSILGIGILASLWMEGKE
ncbi:MAG: TerC family protein [Terriglobia bacterium]